jgi:hypothetical protein
MQTDSTEIALHSANKNPKFIILYNFFSYKYYLLWLRHIPVAIVNVEVG